MSCSQFKPRITNRFDVSMDGIYSLDLPDGTYKMIDDAFKKWEVRRGFITVEEQKLGLRGRAYHYGEFAKKKKEAEKAQKNPPKPPVKKKVVKKKVAKKISKKVK